MTFRRNGEHQTDQNFEPDAMERLPDPNQNVEPESSTDPPWGPMGPLGTTWAHLGPLGTTWDHLGPLGTTWDNLDRLYFFLRVPYLGAYSPVEKIPGH